LLLAGISVVLAAACGGSADVAVDHGTGGTSATGGTNGQGGNGNTGNEGTGAQPIFGGKGNMPTECEPKTCDDLGANCGRAPDGCGDILECGECEDGEICGFKDPNVCSTDDDFGDLCTPLYMDDELEF
jgi:hypothetical protein